MKTIGIMPFILSGAKTMEEFADMQAQKEQQEKDRVRNETEEERAALKAAIAYTRYLKALHPEWSAEKLQRKVAGHLNIKFV